MSKLAFTLTLLGAIAPARAEHQHTVEHDEVAGFGAGVAVVAASFDTMTYAGNYQGVLPTLRWDSGRFAAAASTGVYRLEKNGASLYGISDVSMHGQAVLVGDASAHAGVVAGVSAPVGNDSNGLGMGHFMVMPAAFGMVSRGRVSVVGSAGYSRALGGHSDHQHGAWPLVEPMNVEELTWSAGGDVIITDGIRTGARAAGGVALGGGDHRVVGVVRVGWRAGRVDSGAEVQAGLAGDPFTVRGVVSTALSF